MRRWQGAKRRDDLSCEERSGELRRHNIIRSTSLGVALLTPLSLSHRCRRLDTERTAKVMEALGRLIADSAKSGLLDAPAPIISRTFQVLSEGHERGYMFARKISSTPFPFPFAQAIELFTFVFAFSVPFLFSAWLDGAAPVGAFTFVTSWCYLAMNEVSRMLEEPFGGDANDLPLARMQYEFNRRIERSDFADGYGEFIKRQPSSN